MNLMEAIAKYETLSPRERTIAVGVHLFGWVVDIAAQEDK